MFGIEGDVVADHPASQGEALGRDRAFAQVREAARRVSSARSAPSRRATRVHIASRTDEGRTPLSLAAASNSVTKKGLGKGCNTVHPHHGRRSQQVAPPPAPTVRCAGCSLAAGRQPSAGKHGQPSVRRCARWPAAARACHHKRSRPLPRRRLPGHFPQPLQRYFTLAQYGRRSVPPKHLSKGKRDCKADKPRIPLNKIPTLLIIVIAENTARRDHRI